jgi:hypothetical protein
MAQAAITRLFMIPSQIAIMLGECTGVFVCFYFVNFSTSNVQHKLLSRNKSTYGRWYRFDNKPRFITGIPPLTGHAFKQPVLELYSWTEFFTNRRLVRIAL